MSHHDLRSLNGLWPVMHFGCTDIAVETKSRNLNLNRDISIVETNFLKVSRFSRLSRLTLCQCWDRDSQSRSRRDKSRPPGLNISFNLWVLYNTKNESNQIFAYRLKFSCITALNQIANERLISRQVLFLYFLPLLFHSYPATRP